MRYPAEHKDETRERILRAASRRFRRSGAEGVAIAGLMSELSLTHGGFYRHFRNKDHLLAEALRKGFEETGARLTQAAESAPPGQQLRAVIESYLSELHCANPAEGCPFAALAAEAPRHSRNLQAAMAKAIEGQTTIIARYVNGRSEAERQRNALVLFSGMAGALALARAAGDKALRKNILAAARDFYLQAFDPGS